MIDELSQSWVHERTAQYGEVPPPWILANIDLRSIYWRMGTGEDDLFFWREWRKNQDQSEAQAIAYFRRWQPPANWLVFVASEIWGTNSWRLLPEDEKFGLVQKLDRAGLGSYPPHCGAPAAAIRILSQTARYGAFPPPWFFQREAPDHLSWRVRGGKALIEDWQHWWDTQQLPRARRIAYFKQWGLVPSWMDFVIDQIGVDLVAPEQALKFGRKIGLAIEEGRAA